MAIRLKDILGKGAGAGARAGVGMQLGGKLTKRFAVGTRFLNIEVDDDVVKVCETVKVGNSFRLGGAFLFQTPPGCVDDGQVTDPETLAAVMTQELEEYRLSKVKKAIFTVISGKIPTREVTLPPVREARIKSLIEQNATEYFPIDLSKYRLSYGMLTANEGEEKGSKLLAMAVPLSVIESYVRFAEAAGLEIQAVDYGGNSQYQVVRACRSESVIMCVDVGCTHTFVTIMLRGRLLLQRSLPFGGSDYIENFIDEKTKGESNGYVKTLDKYSEPLATLIEKGALTDEDTRSALSRIINGIDRSLEFYRTTRQDAPIEEVIITGTCAHLAGLKEAVAEATGVDNTNCFSHTRYIHLFDGNAGALTACFSAYGSSVAPVDFLPEQYKQGRSKSKQKEASLVTGLAVFGLGAVGAAVLSIMALSEYNSLSDEKATMERRITQVRYVEPLYEEYLLYSEAAGGFLVLDAAMRTNNEGLVAFFGELEQKMPSSILLLTAVCTETGVVLNVQVPTLEAAAKVLVAFRTFESLAIVDTSAVTDNTDETGFRYYTFAVNCAYGENPWVSAAPEPEPSGEPGDTPNE